MPMSGRHHMGLTGAKRARQRHGTGRRLSTSGPRGTVWESMVELEPFDPALAALVSTWARSPAEAQAWCAYDDVPVPREIVARWSTKPGVTAYGLRDGTDLVGYGELWVDDKESEVELAHLIVSPQRRGQGI